MSMGADRSKIVDTDGNPMTSTPTNVGGKRGLDVHATNSYLDEVVLGDISGVRSFTKFGYRDNLQAASGEQTVWATTGNFTPLTSASTFTIAFNTGTDGLGTTGALSLYFDYVDDSGLYQTTIVTLDSSGSQVTSFSGFGINRVAVVNTGSNQTNGSIITITATTGGTKQAVVPAGQGVTQQAIFHTDANSFGIGKFLWFNINKVGGSSPVVTTKAYVFNRTYSTSFEVFRHTMDTAVENTVALSEPVGFRLSPRDVLYFVSDTNTNDTIVNLRFSLLEYKTS